MLPTASVVMQAKYRRPQRSPLRRHSRLGGNRAFELTGLMRKSASSVASSNLRLSQTTSLSSERPTELGPVRLIRRSADLRPVPAPAGGFLWVAQESSSVPRGVPLAVALWL
jgi:hypothetical protein